MKKVMFLLSAGALFTLIFACKSPSTNKQAAFTPPPTKFIENAGVKIAYTDSGKGDTTLLFVHGWCINKSYWNNQVEFFSPTYRVITMDLGGYGQSGKNRTEWNTQAFASDVNAVIKQLNLKNVVLIGHSMAGDIVVKATLNNPKPIIALVGVDNFKSVGGPAPDAKAKAEYAKAIDSLKHHFKTIAFNYTKQELFSKTTPEQVKKRVLDDIAHSDTTIAAASMEQDNFDEAAMLKETHKPLFLINSDWHPTDVAGLKANHILFDLRYIHLVGHYPMIERPAEFNWIFSQQLKMLGLPMPPH